MQRQDNYAQFETAGINRTVSPFLVRKGEWKMLLNCGMTEIGKVSKRPGYEMILDVPDLGSEILSLIPYEIGGVGKLIMINSSGKAYASVPGVASSWGTAIKTGLNTSERWGYTVLNGNMYLGNGYEGYRTDAEAFHAVANMPTAKFWTTLYQRVYAGGVYASPSTLFWSSTGNGTDWSSVSPSDSSSTDIEKDYKGNIKALEQSNDRVIVLKDKMLKRWDSEIMKTVLDSRGIKAPWSVGELEGMLCYLTDDSILIYDGNSPRPISAPIMDVISAIDMTTLNVNRICGEVFKNLYLLSVGDIALKERTIANAVLVYDYEFNTFAIWSTTHRLTAMARLTTSTGVDKLYAGDENGVVYELFKGDTDNGEEFEMVAETHVIYPLDGGYAMDPKILTVATENPIEMKVKMISDTGSVRLEQALRKPVTNIKTKEGLSALNGFKVMFTQAGKGTPSIYGWSLDYEISDKRYE